MPNSLLRTRRGNPLASKSQLVARVSAIASLASSLNLANQIESPVKDGLHSDEYASFKSQSSSLLQTLNKAASRIRGRLASGKHN